jgi:twitching motility protein PilT
MSGLEAIVSKARELGASDIHLEGALPVGMRMQGDLRMMGEPMAPQTISGFARELLPGDAWNEFVQQRSYDLSRAIAGVRCRVNILHSSRGVGMAIRLLTSFQASLTSLNLHPDLKKLVANKHGLIMVSGPTGSGKSATVAALLQEINVNETRHIMTIESPIEYVLTPRQSLIRQRQVGRDTPSFDQALIDALREDPDVLMVGEMRDPETMRLTLNAAETGHLVITTLHSSSAAEALGRVVSAFPAEVQSGICGQLADCLAAVVCQRLRYRADLKMRIPECEILLPSSGVRGTIRMGQFSRLATALEGGGQEGQWTLARYRAWLDSKKDWVLPTDRSNEPVASEMALEPMPMGRELEAPEAIRRPAPKPTASAAPAARKEQPRKESPPSASEKGGEGVLVIEDIDEDPAAILEKMNRR